MYLLLAPSLAIVWRNAHDLQIGVPRPVAIIHGVTEWEEHIIGALRTGCRIDQLSELARCRLEPDAVQRLDRLLETLEPALVASSSLHRPPAQLAVLGEEVPRRRIERYVGAIGMPLVPLARADVVVVTASYVIRPDLYQPLLARDARHIPVVFSDDSVSVGPLITPGVGPCLYCAERAHAEADPAWAAMVAQLQRRVASSARGLLAVAASIEIGWLLERRAKKSDSAAGNRYASIISTGGQRQRVAVREHPDCLCRSLVQIETVLDSPVASEPTRPPLTLLSRE